MTDRFWQQSINICNWIFHSERFEPSVIYLLGRAIGEEKKKQLEIYRLFNCMKNEVAALNPFDGIKLPNLVLKKKEKTKNSLCIDDSIDETLKVN